jgi:hypothetical protein
MDDLQEALHREGLDWLWKDIEKLDPFRLEPTPLEHKHLLPATYGGIYFVIWEGVIIYVGETKDFYERWKAHHHYDELYEFRGGVRIAYYWFFFGRKLRRQVEQFYIEKFKPILNYRRFVDRSIPESIDRYRTFILWQIQYEIAEPLAYEETYYLRHVEMRRNQTTLFLDFSPIDPEQRLQKAVSTVFVDEPNRAQAVEKKLRELGLSQVIVFTHKTTNPTRAFLIDGEKILCWMYDGYFTEIGGLEVFTPFDPACFHIPNDAEICFKETLDFIGNSKMLDI